MKTITYGLALLGALAILVLPPAAQARLIGSRGIERIASASSAVVVGEVLKAGPAGAPSRKEGSMRIIDMKASIRVLRAISADGSARPSPGDVITLSYENYDPQRLIPSMGSYEFPQLSPGKCLGFPLKAGKAGSGEDYQLLDREAPGSILPCLKDDHAEPVPQDIKAFVVGELANTLAHGGIEDIYRAARFVGEGFTDRPGLGDAIYGVLAHQVGDDERRWLDIAVATYNVQPAQRAKIADLPGNGQVKRTLPELSMKAFSRIGPRGFADKVIRTVFRHSASLRHDQDSGYTLALNFPNDRTTVDLLSERLARRDPRALDITRMIILLSGKPDATLLSAALESAQRLITDRSVRSHLDLQSACVVVRDHGSQEQFGVLLGQMKLDMKADHDRFVEMWRSLAYTKSQRVLPVIRIVITDRAPMYTIENRSVVRVCDDAVQNLQIATGVDFGIQRYASIADRDVTLEKAVHWLSDHPEL